jgi:pimeloyl-ACP methyl ester carboxylesterase
METTNDNKMQIRRVAFSGHLHRYGCRLTAFEFTRPSTPLTNILFWVGGLSDNLLTVDYPTVLAHKLPPSWTIVQVALTSAGSGWGTTTLARDAKELAACVRYFRAIVPSGSKFVLMGHSTGCQDAMEYVTGPDRDSRPAIDGVVLQAPVSDREASAGMKKDEYDGIVDTSRQYVAEGRPHDSLPKALDGGIFAKTAVTAYRWLSLLSPDKDGDDDYFSSDLTDDQLRRSFGRFPATTPLLILCSGEDEHVPKSIHVPAMIQRWKGFVREGGGVVDEQHSGIVEGATHNLDGCSEVVVQRLVDKVNGFVQRVSSGFSDSTSQL